MSERHPNPMAWSFREVYEYSNDDDCPLLPMDQHAKLVSVMARYKPDFDMTTCALSKRTFETKPGGYFGGYIRVGEASE